MSGQFMYDGAPETEGSKLNSGNITLNVIQHPKMGRVAMAKDKDRKPIDPPPMVQFAVSKTVDPYETYLQSSAFFVHCTLVSLDDNRRPGKLASNGMGGTPVSSLHRLKDERNKECAFFIFGDISIREAGEYRLEFHLFELKNNACYHIDSVQCNTFTVYTAKTFPGLEQSTFLTRTFSDQGVRLRVRKEPRSGLKKNGPSSDDYQKKTYNSPKKNSNGKRPRSDSMNESETQSVAVTSASDPSPTQHFQEQPRLNERNSISGMSAVPSTSSSQGSRTPLVYPQMTPGSQPRPYERSQGEQNYVYGSNQVATQARPYFGSTQGAENPLPFLQPMEPRQDLGYSSSQAPIPSLYAGVGVGNFSGQYNPQPSYASQAHGQYLQTNNQYLSSSPSGSMLLSQRYEPGLPPNNSLLGQPTITTHSHGSSVPQFWSIPHSEATNAQVTPHAWADKPPQWAEHQGMQQ